MMDIKVKKDKQLADGLIKRTSSMSEESSSKTMHKDKVINRGKRSRALTEIKPVKIISNNLRSVLVIRPMQKEVLPSHKLQDHAYE